MWILICISLAEHRRALQAPARRQSIFVLELMVYSSVEDLDPL